MGLKYPPRSLLKFMVISILIAALYGAILTDMASDWWNEPSASQGLLIPPLTLYIAWLLRRQTFARPAAPDRRGYLVMGTACMVLLLGRLAAEFFLQRLSLSFCLVGSRWRSGPCRALRTLAFPFLLLATMVPFPGC